MTKLKEEILETSWIVRKISELEDNESKNKESIMTQKTSNVPSSKALTISYNRNYFKEICKRWRLDKDEKDIYYINVRHLNVFDAFRMTSNESRKVTLAYNQSGIYYKIMPPQLMPLYRHDIREIYKENDTAFNIKILEVIIDITKSVHGKDDYTGYCVLKHAFKDCAMKFITMNAWAASILESCRIWSYIDKIDTDNCTVDVTFENVMETLKNIMSEKLATL